MTELLKRLQDSLADRYRIEREIGQGGMATVYLAHDLKHDRDVALKVLRPDLAATLGPERFLREIQIAARLQHPNILPVHDSGEVAGFLYYVMPFVEGHSLRERLSEHGELPVGEAIRILRDVAEALAHAHSHGVLHRDIKPENVMLSGRHALVADFGVAKAVREATGRQKLTTVGVALGTPTYMAPEQAAADPHADHRADIYAFGVTAYELLAGRPPFTGITAQAILAAHLTEAPVSVSGLRPLLPQPLAQLVMRCLEKKPADRPQSAEELLQVLESMATPSGGVTPADTQPVKAVAPARKRPLALVTAAIVTGIGLVAAGFAASAFRHRLPNISVVDMAAVTTEPGVEFQPAISPGGQEVAFVRGAARVLHLVIRGTSQGMGGGEVQFRGREQEVEFFPSWSSAGDLVRFLSCPVGGPFSTAPGLLGCSPEEVGKLGGTVRPIALPPSALAATRIAWSPDGSRLAYTVRDTIFGAAIGDIAALPLAVHRTGYKVLHSLVWSPDGKQIAYVNGNEEWLLGSNVASSSIWVVAASGGAPRRVTSDAFLNVSPTWLDARHLLFVSNRDGARSVYLVEVGAAGAGGEPRVVPGIADPHSISYSAASHKLAWAKFNVRQNIRAYPLGRSAPLSIADGKAITSGTQVIEWHDVSPDGRWLAFDSNRRGDMDIYRMSIDGGEVIPITSLPGDQFHPDWSPDGAELAFYGRDPACARDVSATEIMLIPAQGGTARALTCSPGYDIYPAWSPDGRSIAFTSVRTGRREIWAMSRDSAGAWKPAVQLTDFVAFGMEWLPDGRGVIGIRPNVAGIFIVALDKRLVWTRDIDADHGLHRQGNARPSRDGRTIYVGGVHRDGRAGIWAFPVGSGTARLVIAFDDPSLDALGGVFFSVGKDRLYLTVSEFESDIWVASLRY